MAWYKKGIPFFLNARWYARCITFAESKFSVDNLIIKEKSTY